MFFGDILLELPVEARLFCLPNVVNLGKTGTDAGDSMMYVAGAKGEMQVASNSLIISDTSE